VAKALSFGLCAMVPHAPQTAAQAPIQAISAPTSGPVDAALDQAESLIGRALFLRGFYATDDLSYDAKGVLVPPKNGSPKVDDWTLAGIDILQAGRNGPGEIEFKGVRVVIRYNQQAHQFERLPQNKEPNVAKMKVRVGAPPPDSSAAGFPAALAAIFAQGIDSELERSTPPLWRHYFNPGAPWPPDALTGEQIVTPGPGTQGFVEPKLEHRSAAAPSPYAEHSPIHGHIQFRVVVDTQGVPRRISLVLPLGYGVETREAEALAKWRFTPALLNGRPVAATILVDDSLEPGPPGHP